MLKSKASGKRSNKQISDLNQLRHTKYRRTKNMIKKSIEVGNQCQLDIILVIFDKRQNRYREVHTNPDFTMDNFMDALGSSIDQTNGSHRIQAHNYKR